MKKIVFVVIPLLFIGCSTTGTKQLIDYDMTNPVKIEQSIKGLDIVTFIEKHVSDGEKIVICSIEEDLLRSGKFESTENKYHLSTSNLDWGTKYLIEDNFITTLASAGYKILERDPELLPVFDSESGEQYSLSNLTGIFTENSDEEAKTVGKDDTIEDVSRKHYGEDQKNETRRNFQITTELSSADKILTYRVLECGVIIENDPKDFTNFERLVRTRLHCRLEDAKTSEILVAGVVENEIVDKVEKSQLDWLDGISYKTYYHSLPNIQGNVQKKSVIKIPIQNGTGSTFPTPILIGLGVFVLVLALTS